MEQNLEIIMFIILIVLSLIFIITSNIYSIQMRSLEYKSSTRFEIFMIIISICGILFNLYFCNKLTKIISKYLPLYIIIVIIYFIISILLFYYAIILYKNDYNIIISIIIDILSTLNIIFLLILMMILIN